ncbi:MAG: RagB/SusD family nutrient uptake outer membrane protein [Marinifilaceae bacterium]|jgi:hypothetical protein|nr:RagB/SusD family nutrient uptake outer membrane protein [Marinifilaceae bacterium]
MKKNIIILSLIAILFSSCDDFLEERSHDRLIPKTVESYSEMLYGEAYLKLHDQFVKYIELMTDDVADVNTGSNNDVRADGWGYFTWQKDPQSRRNGSVFIDNTWANFYKYILTCNIVIKDIKEGKVEGEKEKLQDLEAEAHFLRSWYYYTLLNLFGEPYDKNSADVDLGIPINNLTESKDVKFNRESVKAVYEFIKADILESIRLFEEAKIEKDYFRANLDVAYLLASRVFLFCEEWENAVTYSNKLIERRPNLYDYSSKANPSWWYGKYGSIITSKSPELLFTYADASETFFPEGASAYFIYSAELLSAFDANDNRLHASFPKKYNYAYYKPVVKKYGLSSNTKVFGFGFRTAEAYLNKAEALCHIDGKYTEATSVIEDMRAFRYKKGTDLTANAKDQAEALDIVKKERRLELCFEGFRWFDLRRWGRPSITHNYTVSSVASASNKYVLEENDPAYTLPLPTYVRDVNPDIKRITRPVRAIVED